MKTLDEKKIMANVPLNGRSLPLSKEEAEGVAVEVFRYLSSDIESVRRFLAVTGLSMDTLRQASEQPGFLRAVLEYISANEADLLACAQKTGLTPQKIADARGVLKGD